MKQTVQVNDVSNSVFTITRHVLQDVIVVDDEVKGDVEEMYFRMAAVLSELAKVSDSCFQVGRDIKVRISTLRI